MNQYKNNADIIFMILKMFVSDRIIKLTVLLCILLNSDAGLTVNIFETN